MFQWGCHMSLSTIITSYEVALSAGPVQQCSTEQFTLQSKLEQAAQGLYLVDPYNFP